MCSEKYFKSVTDQGFTIALRLVWRLLDAYFAFSSCRPPQTVHYLGMALAKTLSLTTSSQHRETCRKWNALWDQIWLCHRADLLWLEAAAHQRGTIQIRLENEFQTELNASRPATAENRVP